MIVDGRTGCALTVGVAPLMDGVDGTRRRSEPEAKQKLCDKTQNERQDMMGRTGGRSLVPGTIKS